jgi:predicted ArsR family transcriptional regulator
MDVPRRTAAARVLDQPTRALVFALVSEREEAMRVDDLAAELGLHPNAVRGHLRRLEAVGLVRKVPVPQGPGRPPYVWSVQPDAKLADTDPDAYRDLATWVGEFIRSADGAIAAGRAIGRDIGPGGAAASVEALKAALETLGCKPELDINASGSISYRLNNCPDDRAGKRGEAAVCPFHRGVIQGMLDAIGPDATLTTYIPGNPREGGCSVTIERLDAQEGTRGMATPPIASRSPAERPMR